MGTVQNIMGVLYSCTTFLGMFNMMSVMPILGYERSVMYRLALTEAIDSQNCLMNARHKSHTGQEMYQSLQIATPTHVWHKC